MRKPQNSTTAPNSEIDYPWKEIGTTEKPIDNPKKATSVGTGVAVTIVEKLKDASDDTAKKGESIAE